MWYILSFHMNKLYFLAFIVGWQISRTMLFAQESFPINGIHDERETYFLIRNANIQVSPSTQLERADMLIYKGKIVTIDRNIKTETSINPVIIDLEGRYIYAAFIDAYSDYGMPRIQELDEKSRRESAPNYLSGKRGAFTWNDAVHPQDNAITILQPDEQKADELRKKGVAAVLSHFQDGIVRGTGALLYVGNKDKNLSIIKPHASSHFSFKKGTSQQSYPSSLMGSIALLRQTYLDAAWYTKDTTATYAKEGVNLSLAAFQKNLTLPAIFEVGDKWDCLRADRIADEFKHEYIIKASGSEYQIIDDIQATGAKYILPLNFPKPYELNDEQSLRFISLKNLKHWEMAPANPYFFQEAGIPFCLTLAGLSTVKEVLAQMRKVVEYGLKEETALAALTTQPASFLQVADQLGTLEKGKVANFIVCNGSLFEKETTIMETWVYGDRYIHELAYFQPGYFRLTISSPQKQYAELVKVDNNHFSIEKQNDTFSTTAKTDAHLCAFQLNINKINYSFSGVIRDKYSLYGTATDEELNTYTWTMTWKNKLTSPPNPSSKTKVIFSAKDIVYPFNAYGNKEVPKAQNLLIKDATVWTNTNRGVQQGMDVLVLDGKIAAIGNNLNAASGTIVINASNKHLTPGIIDEHSHIAITRGVNEVTQSVTSEVRIGDVLNPDDINIYRQLSGGVTSSHLLHGSANAIGGQTQLIKLKWGKSDHALKFPPWTWTPFIKFALGENVKQSNWGENYTSRFPQTRMGVEQVMDDAFTRARIYAEKQSSKVSVKPDLELDALVEILNGKRYITCHSYVQSEINMMMHIANKHKFTLNTFTHILEGYKLADKMKDHKANASTFSDWHSYKYEVLDAIPYNAAIMQKVGLNVAINSDDAEMARRLNQEAAKMVRYGDIKEEDALKAVTLNPAKMLHIDDKVGSIAIGKDADLVIWSDHPLSIYAKVEKTIIEGVVYYDVETDKQLKEFAQKEKRRLLEKMKKSAKDEKTQPLTLEIEDEYECEGVKKHLLFNKD